MDFFGENLEFPNSFSKHFSGYLRLGLFPRVPRTDAILFAAQSHGLSQGKMCFFSANGVQDVYSHD